MPVLEALGETGVEPHVVCFGVALLKGVRRGRFRRNAQLRGSGITCGAGGASLTGTTSTGGCETLTLRTSLRRSLLFLRSNRPFSTSHNEQFSGQELCGFYGLALYELLLSARAAMCVYGFCLNVAFCGFSSSCFYSSCAPCSLEVPTAYALLSHGAAGIPRLGRCSEIPDIIRHIAL